MEGQKIRVRSSICEVVKITNLIFYCIDVGQKIKSGNTFDIVVVNTRCDQYRCG